MEHRHDLDWLRILLFALLVPHHVAVGFVDWAQIYTTLSITSWPVAECHCSFIGAIAGAFHRSF